MGFVDFDIVQAEGFFIGATEMELDAKDVPIVVD